ncbi:MAG: 4Fe-4S dicluster domain-containing protein [Firmicutes bacterium]|nr:4Fe-4S dicluster domain-containing protein [Bacillota bacterium]
MQKIREAGVTGAGGAGFPTHAKLDYARVDRRVECLIANGAECEPLLQGDKELMITRARDLVNGVLMAVQITGAEKPVIAVKARYAEVVEALRKAIPGTGIQLVTLDDFYPAGDEQVLVYEIAGRVVPEGGIPLGVGVVVQNVQTLINIDAATRGIPVTDRYLTIAGDVPQPVTVKVPIGTSVRALLEEYAGGVSGRLIIDGGPMMGRIVDENQVVTKTTGGLILLPGDHPLVEKRALPAEKLIRRSRAACVQCSQCTDLCPRRLLGHRIQPHQVMRALGYNLARPELLLQTLICSECGVCDLVCPMGLTPRAVNIMFKRQLAREGVKYTPGPVKYAAGPDGYLPHPMREYRKVPVKRILSALGLSSYYRKAPLAGEEFRPEKVGIPLRQHIGTPAQPVVQPGDRVKKGDLIAEIPAEALGIRMHASITGVVEEVGERITIVRSGEE